MYLTFLTCLTTRARERNKTLLEILLYLHSFEI